MISRGIYTFHSLWSVKVLQDKQGIFVLLFIALRDAMALLDLL